MSDKPQYDELAQGYIQHGFDPDGTDGLVQIWMEQELGADLKQKTLVDVGMGAGRWLPKFIERGVHRVIGVDESCEMLSQVPGGIEIFDASRGDVQQVLLHSDQISLVQGDLTTVLPNLGESADVAFSSYSLCVTDQPKHGLQAMHSVLKPGGIGLVSTNVFVDSSLAPTQSTPIREVDFDASAGGLNPLRSDGSGAKELRLVLHLPGANVPLRDCAHVLQDYRVDPDQFAVEKSHLVRPQGLTFVDGNDYDANMMHYGDSHPHIVSVQGTSAQLAHLCLRLKKL